jgi:hypothetical protein
MSDGRYIVTLKGSCSSKDICSGPDSIHSFKVLSSLQLCNTYVVMSQKKSEV